MFSGKSIFFSSKLCCFKLFDYVLLGNKTKYWLRKCFAVQFSCQNTRNCFSTLSKSCYAWYMILRGFYIAESIWMHLDFQEEVYCGCEHVSCVFLCLNYPVLWFVCVCVWSETCGSTVCSWGARCVQNKCECQQCTGQSVKPVCGSDGTTYNNDCELRLAVCKKQRKIEVAKPGACDEGGFMCSCLW